MDLSGAAYWIWSATPEGRLSKPRLRNPRHRLGNLTVIGMLVFAIGRIISRVD